MICTAPLDVFDTFAKCKGYKFFQICGLLLDSRISGSECYPIDNDPYCLSCNRKYLTNKNT